MRCAEPDPGEAVVRDAATLGCVECHMPLIQRPVVAGGQVRPTRRHWWRGGHDPAMVRQALDIQWKEIPAAAGMRRFELALTNTGAGHHVPTGTPDRHLTVALRLLDANGETLKEDHHLLQRVIL